MRPCWIRPTSRPRTSAPRAIGRYSQYQKWSSTLTAYFGAASNGDGKWRSMRKTGANTSRIGWPKPSAVSCIRGVCSGKPQSQGGARRTRPW